MTAISFPLDLSLRVAYSNLIAPHRSLEYHPRLASAMAVSLMLELHHGYELET